MIPRDVGPYVLEIAKKMPAIAFIGPRQSGKTTLAQALFPNHRYISLEEFEMREIATKDPRKFLRDIKNDYGVILDEFQNAPTILSYIQTIIDTENKPGYFILSGSQNFLVNQAISQSLAGRVAIITLLPFSAVELQKNNLLAHEPELAIFSGGYPRIIAQQVPIDRWYPDYIRTYLERDVRMLQNVGDLGLFKKFIQLCAGRIGQLLNVSSLASDCGISAGTAHSWLSVLEASYIIFLLQPHHKNFSKRLIKMPKLYFFDTGLACALLGIESAQELAQHYLRGGLFESWVISELFKQSYNALRDPRIYFWRDSHGHEVDCIIEKAQRLVPIEIKSALTIGSDFFDALNFWNKLTSNDPSHSFVVYAGNQNFSLTAGNVIGWQSLEVMWEKIQKLQPPIKPKKKPRNFHEKKR